MASRGGGVLCTVVPAPGATHPTVVDRRLQVLVVCHSGRNGACLFFGVGSASASAASSSTAAPAGALRLGGSDKLCVHSYEICREPLDRVRELGDGSAIARHGCRQVCDSVHRLLLKLPVVWVCVSVVCGAVRSAGFVSKQESPLPVCGREKYLEMWEHSVVRRLLIPFPTICRKNARIKHDLVRVVHNLLA